MVSKFVYTLHFGYFCTARASPPKETSYFGAITHIEQAWIYDQDAPGLKPLILLSLPHARESPMAVQ